MINPPFRSPRSKVGGIYHFGRMIDKIRCSNNGTLPDEYRPNFGLSIGLDGHLCGFLGIKFGELSKEVDEKLSDDELLEWCFDRGVRLNSVQKRVWNGFAAKFGWRDRASRFIDQIKTEEGMSDRHDIRTAFDGIDEREGRNPSEQNAAHQALSRPDVKKST